MSIDYFLTAFNYLAPGSSVAAKPSMGAWRSIGTGMALVDQRSYVIQPCDQELRLCDFAFNHHPGPMGLSALDRRLQLIAYSPPRTWAITASLGCSNGSAAMAARMRRAIGS